MPEALEILAVESAQRCLKQYPHLRRYKSGSVCLGTEWGYALSLENCPVCLVGQSSRENWASRVCEKEKCEATQMTMGTVCKYR